MEACRQGFSIGHPEHILIARDRQERMPLTSDDAVDGGDLPGTTQLGLLGIPWVASS